MDGSSQREAARRQSARTGGQGVCRRVSVRSGEDGRHAGDQHGLHESRRGPSEKARDSCAPGRTSRFSSLAIGGCLRALLSTGGCYFFSTVVKRAPTPAAFSFRIWWQTANFFCGVKSRPTLFEPTPKPAQRLLEFFYRADQQRRVDSTTCGRRKTVLPRNRVPVPLPRGFAEPAVARRDTVAASSL